jgi:protein-disulfide isomerase
MEPDRPESMDETVEEGAEIDTAGPVQPPASAGTEEDTITFKRTHFFSVLVLLAFAGGLGLGYVLWGGSSGSETLSTSSVSPDETVNEESTGNRPETSNANGSESSQLAQAEPTSIPRYDIPLDDDPRLGPDDAEILIVEFSDFECPYCKKFHNEVFHQLMEAFPDQIQFVYRDFPLTSIHPNAFSAAEAANCAAEQGDFYWDYHDLLFAGAYGLGREAYVAYATQLDINIEDFEACLDEGRYQDEVQADYDFASQFGISSTPTFFINGLPVIGAQPLEIFTQIIERELAGEIK